MKYSEFEELIKGKGFDVENNRYEILVCDDGSIVSSVSKIKTMVMSTNYTSFMVLDDGLRIFVGQKCMELAFTNLEDREEEEKYYYRLKGFDERRIFLKKFKHSNYIILSTYFDVKNEQYSLTDAEFEALPEDIKSHNWEKIKVDREWSEMD